MFAQIDATGGWSALYALLEHRGMDLTDPTIVAYDDVPTLTLVPAFMLSELRAASHRGIQDRTALLGD